MEPETDSQQQTPPCADPTGMTAENLFIGIVRWLSLSVYDLIGLRMLLVLITPSQGTHEQFLRLLGPLLPILYPITDALLLPVNGLLFLLAPLSEQIPYFPQFNLAEAVIRLIHWSQSFPVISGLLTASNLTEQNIQQACPGVWDWRYILALGIWALIEFQFLQVWKRLKHWDTQRQLDKKKASILARKRLQANEAAEATTTNRQAGNANWRKDLWPIFQGLLNETEYLQEKSTQDALTRLNNRGSFDSQLNRLIAACRQNQEPLTLILADVDHFKQINDRYGHSVGDAVLQAIGQSLKQLEKSEQAIQAFRYGGEEIALLASGWSVETAYRQAEMIRNRLSKTTPKGLPTSHPITVSVGVGVGVFQLRRLDTTVNKPFIIQTVDKALYQAKENGRNQVVLTKWPGTESV
ncbi:MAG: GGDEF domain-containing protein [Candidatus Melainabacteria bacterium]|nr:GGDEF domain-containing protein [Candidatus Melainabacteria bacterium]